MADNVLQRKFTALLKETCTFFEELDVNGPRDLAMLQSLRTRALEFAAERSHPSFPSMLAYLLGVTDIPTHYPLQPIRYLALVAANSFYGGLSNDIPLDELFTAAFVADLGFRASWLGHHGDHRQVATYRLEALKQQWYTPRIHNWILEHHDPAKDSSPNKLLSFYSRFLELVHGLGSDHAKPEVTTPARAMDRVVQEFNAYPQTVKSVLRTLSAFPVGTWVRLSTGEAALVIAANSDNPLRPRIGRWHGNQWQTRELSGEPSIHISREEAPTLEQRNFLNHPAYWIPDWTGPKPLTAQAVAEAFNQITPTVDRTGSRVEGSANAVNATQDVIADVFPGPIVPATPNTALEGPSTEELIRVREEWDLYVRQVEDAVSRLKMGVVDSYKRENERYKAMLKNTPGAGKTAPAPIVEKPNISGILLPIERRLEAVEEYLAIARAAISEKRNEMRESLSRTRVKREALSKVKPFALDTLASLMTQIDAQWEHRTTQTEAELLGAAWAEPPRFAELESHLRTARLYLEHLRVGSAEVSRWDSELSTPLESLWQKAREAATVQLQWQAAQVHRVVTLEEGLVRLEKVFTRASGWEVLQRGIAARQGGQSAEAARYFEQAVTMQSDFWEGYAALGLCYLSQKDKRAIDAFERAAAINPEESSLRLCLDFAKKLLTTN